MADFVVVAFGGNAILPAGGRGTLEEQRAHVRHMAAEVGRLILTGHRVVITHGNGPQVGEIMLRSDLAREIVPPLTLDVAGAMSQGQIGYMLQSEIGSYLRAKGADASVCSLVTQVLVDVDDPAFRNPTKPIGRFYTADEAQALRAERGWVMVEDAGRGYRRVVPSPMPLEIIEWPAVQSLVFAGTLVIAAGGGGIPVVREGETGLRGVEAVIDKDFASERLATLVRARTLVLLTGVPTVAVDFGTPNQRSLEVVSLDELKVLDEAGQFPPGSMGPKVRAAITFLQSGGERVIITDPPHLVEAVNGSGGTQVVGHVRSGVAQS